MSKPLDSDLAIRTAMYFDMGIPMEDAFNMVGVPADEEEAWDDLWEKLENSRQEDSENS